MGKKSRRKAKNNLVSAQADLYIPAKVLRPFAGLANEAEMVAMRELLPAATLKLKTNAEYGNKEFTLVTIAPQMAQGVVLADGQILLAMQTQSRSNDPAHDLGLILEKLLKAEPGTTLSGEELRRKAPRLTEMLSEEPGEFKIWEDFRFWMPKDQEETAEVKEALAQTKEQLVPCEQLQERVYWFEMNGEEYVRWVCVSEEEAAYDALARLRAKGKLDWENAEFIGAFRGLGVVVPVWRLLSKHERDNLADLREQVQAYQLVLEEALNDTTALDAQARQMRAGIVSRQVSLN